jgi:hypothetical protein
MRPLASPVLEQRLLGAVDFVAGLAFGVLAVSDGRPAARAAVFVVAAALFGSSMYLLTYRRFLREAVESAPRAPSAATLERTAVTLRRVLAWALASVAVVVVFEIAVTGSATVAGAILAGNGTALLAISRWAACWQNRHGLRLLKEPRYRWGRYDGRLGRGLMDSRDFYVASSETAPGTIAL